MKNSDCCETAHNESPGPSTAVPERTAEGKTLVIIGGGSAAFAAALKAADLGARILAPEGVELLMEISLAIKFGIAVRDLAACFHPYLTLSEGVKLAALTFSKDVNKLSCCAG